MRVSARAAALRRLSSIQPSEYSLSYPPPLYPKGVNEPAHAG